MKLKVEQLTGQLAQGLAPIYLISGDEPLQVMEATDTVRQAARAQGFSEREVLNVEPGFDWGNLLAASNTMSLFAERRIIELRVPNGKPGDAGGKALSAYAENPPEDSVLLVTMPKLEAAAQRSAWFKAVEAAGAVVQIWPLEPRQLPGWIQRRMADKGLQAAPEVVTLLAERVEGNLLAAAQEIEKLHLLYGSANLDIDTVTASVADSARFDIYGLVDAALDGESGRAVRILQGLRGEGVEPVLVLWALARELRSMAGMASTVEAGQSVDAVLQQYRVWERRKPLLRKGLQRHNRRRWQQMLRRAARVDRVIKGAAEGNAWDELLQLTLLLAGVRLFGGAAVGRKAQVRA